MKVKGSGKRSINCVVLLCYLPFLSRAIYPDIRSMTHNESLWALSPPVSFNISYCCFIHNERKLGRDE